MTDPEKQLQGFLAKYDAAIGTIARAALKEMRARLPGAVETVYDNYNALAIAFGGSDRRSDFIFSITLYPRWVSLFFTEGAQLPDPKGLLKGSGSKIRHIVLDDATTLDHPAVKTLMREALKRAATPIDKKAPRRLVIKSISKKQRPRRPS